ncbi:UDP-glycosyltransferase 74F2-like [Prosopis cineraria]|uniref:UDP-glycosyltransferase 74F2-like n=1 Tax=Prosopis cineraria TaxID=364024 RepID=UPI00240FC57B|nr:UDP-glycosyltransferase 74F2-like [Prosopis cineraria]
MEDGRQIIRRPHCLVLLYPAQGHINPMLQFSKRLDHKGVRVTLVATRFLRKTLKLDQHCLTSMALESISDGFDHGGFEEAGSDQAYIDRFWDVGPKSFEQLLQKLTLSSSVDCVVYDSFLPWALEVAKKFEVIGAAFFTQSCSVNSIYYHACQGNLKKIPQTDDHQSEISLPALPTFAMSDLPSFLDASGLYPAFSKMVVNQFSDIEKADWVLCNSFYELEPQVADWQSKIFPLRTIGPTIPSMFLDKRLKDDNAYGLSFYKEENDVCLNWLGDKPAGSVVYVSFGSIASLNNDQMEELAWGLKDSESYFLWIVREPEKPKLPKNFLDISQNKQGLVITWCPQLQVLDHEAVGCFVTHCGWNSTLEAVSLGVPMVAVPQWTDQPTNAKYIKDVWKMGVKAEADEKGIVRRETVKKCIQEVMQSERGKEMKRNAMKWKSLAAKACDEGGSSNKNIDDFVASFVPSAKCTLGGAQNPINTFSNEQNATVASGSL